MQDIQYIRFVAALALVLGLVALAGYLLRRFGSHWLHGRRQPEARRLQLLETLALDTRNRVVRIADGEREHVLLLGAAGAIVMESRAREVATLTSTPTPTPVSAPSVNTRKGAKHA